MAQINHVFHGRELAFVILSLLSISVFAQKKPTLMILPSDNWCTQRYFTTTYENQGETVRVPNYQQAFQEDLELNPVISKVGELMTGLGYSLKDAEMELKSISTRTAEDNATLSKSSGAQLTESPLDMLKRRAKADIIIKNSLASISFSDSKNKIGYNSDDKIFKLYTATIGNVSLYKKKQTVSSTSIILDGNSQNADNSDAINSYLNTTVDQVTLQRSFVGDGGWYTLCLPFALTPEDIKDQFQGADFQEFTGMTLNTDNSFSLNFNKVTETKAGVPYMVRPINGSNIQNPVFTNKTIEVDQPATVTHRCENTTSYECSFTGIFNPTDVHDRTIRFISADGVTLKMAAADDNSKLKGFRAYIKLPSESTAAKINCVDTTNGITTAESDVRNTKPGVYDLFGRYIGPSVKGLGHGVYIVKGRKIIIK